MTCIIGIENNGKVLMGADSASVTGWLGVQTTCPKVFRLGNLLIGYTTSFRMGQILQHHLCPPEDQHPDNPEAYLVRQLVPEIRSLFKEHGYMSKDNEREAGGQFLVGYKSKLFVIDSDFQVNHFSLGYYAIGTGQEYALGSLHSTEYVDTATGRIDRALAAAEKFCIGVMAPFYFEVSNGAE